MRAQLAIRLEEDFGLPKKKSYEAVDTLIHEILTEIERELRLRSRADISGLGFFKRIDFSTLDKRDFLSSKIIFTPSSNAQEYKRY